MIAAVAGIGGVIGTVAAGTLEYDTLQRLGAVPMSVAGLLVVIHRSRTAGQRLQTTPTWTDLSYAPPTGPEESGGRTPPV